MSIWTKLRDFLFILFATLTIAGFASFVYHFRMSNEDDIAQKYQRYFDASLPQGTPRHLVEKWLQDRGIYFTNLVDVGIYAEMERQSFFQNFEIQISFYFDDQERIEKVKVEAFLVSL